MVEEDKQETGCKHSGLASALLQFPCLVYSSNLKLELLRSPETSVNLHWARRHYIQTDITLQHMELIVPNQVIILT